MSEIRIRFDGPPGPEGGRFVEVENDQGTSICFGRWIEDGEYWLLVFDDLRAANETLEARIAKLEKVAGKAYIACQGSEFYGQAELGAALAELEGHDE